MIVATVRGGGPDGTLAVVSPDRSRILLPAQGPRTLQQALDDWDRWEAVLAQTYERLCCSADGFPVSAAEFLSPLPRGYQWAEGSCYLSHMERIRRSRGYELPPDHGKQPLIYQSGIDHTLAPKGDVVLPDPDWGLDLEATIAIIVDEVPVGASRDEAAAAIRFVLITNDLTYRNLLPQEYARGAGFYQGKPARAYAPFAVSPQALGGAWRNGTLYARIHTGVNGWTLGDLRSEQDIAFDFPTILTHLARTRTLAAGSVVGTGTVSNRDAARGYGCLAERRADEELQDGAAITPYLAVGDTLTIDALSDEGASVFGRIEQRVVAPVN